MLWRRRGSDPKESPRLTPEEAALRDLEFDMRGRIQQERKARMETVSEVLRLVDVERRHREKQMDDLSKQLADRPAGAAASTGSAHARTLDYLSKMQEDLVLSSSASKEGQKSLASSLEQVLLQQTMQSKHLQQLSAGQEQLLIALGSRLRKSELSQVPGAAPAEQVNPGGLSSCFSWGQENPACRASSQLSGEDDDRAVESAGLWHDVDKARRHVITNTSSQPGGFKVELKAHSPRCFSVAGAPKGMGEATLSEDAQGLVWSSGVPRDLKVADSFAGAADPDDDQEGQSAPMSETAPVEVPMAVQKSRSRRHSLMQQDKAEDVRLAWLAQRGLIKTQDIPSVRSAMGDVLRYHMGHQQGAIGVAVAHVASYFDWVEVQRRNKADERSRRIDRLVQSYIFESVVASLIIANALYIGHAANWYIRHPLEAAPEHFEYVNLGFFLVFTVELFLRMVSLGKKFLFGPDAVWYLLDAVVLSVSAIEIAAGRSESYAWLRSVRAFKLVRVIRMVRTISFFRELRLMMDCMMGSLVSLFWFLVLIVFMLYLFSLIFVQGFADITAELVIRQQTEESPTVHLRGEEHDGQEFLGLIQERYGSISRAMLRLWISTTGGVDWQDEYFLVQMCGEYHAIVFLAFIGFMLIVVWNIVTSTIVEKALRYAQPDIDQLLMEKRRKDDEDVELLCYMLDKENFDLNGKITRENFVHLLEKKDVAEFLQARGIDIKEAHTFFALIGEEEGVDPVSFILSCLRISGFATSIDLHTTHHQLMRVLQEQSQVLQELTVQRGATLSTHDVLSTISRATDCAVASAHPPSEPRVLSL